MANFPNRDDNQEKVFLKDIKKLLAKSIEIVKNHPYLPGDIAFKQNMALVDYADS